MTASPDFDFDLGASLPLAAHAAHAVTDAAKIRLFEQLEAAAAAWSDPSHGPQKSALAALYAVSVFLADNPFAVSGRLGRSFDLLWLELKNAPAANAGKILPPWDSRQTSDRARRQAVNYLKGAAAYAAERLYREAGPLHAAASMVADCLAAHRFPFGAGRSDEPWRAILAWRAQGQRLGGRPTEAARAFAQLCERSPLPLPPTAKGKDIMAWLGDELERAGYERAV